MVILKLFKATVSKSVNSHKSLKNTRAMNELLVTQMFYPTILLIMIKNKLTTFRDSKSWTPLRSQNIKTNTSITVNVWVVYFGSKRHL